MKMKVGDRVITNWPDTWGHTATILKAKVSGERWNVYQLEPDPQYTEIWEGPARFSIWSGTGSQEGYWFREDLLAPILHHPCPKCNRDIEEDLFYDYLCYECRFGG
jgi:hypothetical protein